MGDTEFTLTFHRPESPTQRYPNGYWYAVTNDGGWDAVGASPEDAMAELINVLSKALDEVK